MRFYETYYKPSDEKGGSHTDHLEATLKREIHQARNIQLKLLNGEKPLLSTGEMSGVSIPARLIGGDYFDFYPLENGKVRIIIGDVMGKGIPAAMLMILTRGAFRSASENTPGPGETISSMNNALFSDLRKLGSFVTVFCADWDPVAGVLTYSNAGHILPIIIGNNGKVIQAEEVKGVMLGGLPNQHYVDRQIRLSENDLVFFYTDGIVEARNKQGEMFKQERLIQALIEHAEEKAEIIEQNIIEIVNNFAEGMPQKDDITMVTLKVGDSKVEISSLNSPLLYP